MRRVPYPAPQRLYYRYDIKIKTLVNTNIKSEVLVLVVFIIIHHAISQSLLRHLIRSEFTDTTAAVTVLPLASRTHLRLALATFVNVDALIADVFGTVVACLH